MGRFKKGRYEHSMFGAMTDLHVWDSILSHEERKQWTHFATTVKGIVDLSTFYDMRVYSIQAILLIGIQQDGLLRISMSLTWN